MFVTTAIGGFEQRERSVGFVGFGDEPGRPSIVGVGLQHAVDAA